MFAFFPLLMPRNCNAAHRRLTLARSLKLQYPCGPARGGRCSYLFENVVEVGPLAGVLVPAFVHQAETVGGSFIHGNDGSAERRGRLQTLHDFCRTDGWSDRCADRQVSHLQAAASPRAGMSIMA